MDAPAVHPERTTFAVPTPPCRTLRPRNTCTLWSSAVLGHKPTQWAQQRRPGGLSLPLALALAVCLLRSTCRSGERAWRRGGRPRGHSVLPAWPKHLWQRIATVSTKHLPHSDHTHLHNVVHNAVTVCDAVEVIIRPAPQPQQHATTVCMERCCIRVRPRSNLDLHLLTATHARNPALGKPSLSKTGTPNLLRAVINE